MKRLSLLSEEGRRFFGTPQNAGSHGALEKGALATGILRTICAMCERAAPVTKQTPVVGIRGLFFPDSWRYVLVNGRDFVIDAVVCSTACLCKALDECKDISVRELGS